MQVFNRLSYLILIGFVIGCAQTVVTKKKQPPQPVGISEIAALERDWIVDQRVAQRLLIDEKEIIIGIFQVRDSMENIRHFYVLKSANRLFVTRKTDNQIQSLSWAKLPNHFNFEPYTLPDRQILVNEVRNHVQKSLYLDLFHCRKVNEYPKIMELASSERSYLYLQPSRYIINSDMLGKVPGDWVYKYNVQSQQIESVVPILKSAATLYFDSLVLHGNITEISGEKLFDNVVYRADSFRFRCRGPYWYNLNVISHEGWKPNHFASFDSVIDDRASYLMNQDIKAQSPSGSAFDEQFEGLSTDVFDDFKGNLRDYEKSFNEALVDASLAHKLAILN